MRVTDQELLPPLGAEIEAHLLRIEPSILRGGRYFPCSVVLKDGTSLDRVLVVSQIAYIRVWGVYPENDPEKKSIGIVDVASIAESPFRLPARYASKLYAAGESGIGYVVFTVIFSDGSRQAYVTGNAVDFVEYPEGKTLHDVVDVLPHVGRENQPRRGPAYYWCLYCDEETNQAAARGLTQEHIERPSSLNWATWIRYLAKRLVAQIFTRPVD